MASEIRASVLSALSAGPLDGDGLLKKIPEIEDKKQLANLMYNLRKAGLVDKGDDGRYQLKHAASPRTPTGKRRGRSPAATGTRAILEKLLTETQGALDNYLASVGDPQILGPLVAARDSARAALAACEKG